LDDALSNQEINSLIADFLHCNINIANIYLNILQEPKTKKALFDDHPIISQELNNYLDVLSSYRLIADYSGRDKTQIFFAIDPQFSFPAMLLAEMWEVDVNLHTISDLIERHDLIELNSRYKQCQIIIKNIRSYYKKQLPFLKEMVIVINGYKRIASYLSELLETATTNIFAVISPPHLLGEIVWQTVIEKMSKGISYQRITTFDELIRHGYVIYKNEINNYKETLYICKNNVLSDKFYIINDITIVFFIPDRKNKDFKFEVQIIRNAGFSKRYKDIYEKLRGESLNLADLLQKITSYRAHLLQKASLFLNALEHNWFTDVFDYGVFCKHQEYPSKVCNAAITKCQNKGIITINAKNEILANYSLQVVIDHAL
jgi:hypothetical protein